MNNPHTWTRTRDALPPLDTAVEGKIEDASGSRSCGFLKRTGASWLRVGTGYYVHYVPTHWRLLND